MKAKQYKFTGSDTKRIEALGYIITVTGSLSLSRFLSQEFPNFDLVSLLEEVERSFTPTTKLVIKRHIIFTEHEPSLRIYYRNDFTIAEEALVFDREFSKSNNLILVNHSYCVLPIDHQGKGLIKKVFQASLQQYVNMNLTKIAVHAGLNGGGHVWARHGFTGVDKKEIEKILKDAEQRLSPPDFEPVELIFNKYYTDYPNGKAFPMVLWAMFDFMKEVLRGQTGMVNLI